MLDGEYVGRKRVWHDVWLSEAALEVMGESRDLAKLGIEHPSQLERPLPDGIIIAAKVALRRNDDGSDYNRVVRFDVVAVEPPAPEPFAPTADRHTAESCDADGFDWRNGKAEGVPTP